VNATVGCIRNKTMFQLLVFAVTTIMASFCNAEADDTSAANSTTNWEAQFQEFRAKDGQLRTNEWRLISSFFQPVVERVGGTQIVHRTHMSSLRADDLVMMLGTPNRTNAYTWVYDLGKTADNEWCVVFDVPLGIAHLQDREPQKRSK
jgi:hypothetical protein